MPGRPRTMAKKVETLWNQQIALLEALEKVMPAMYAEPTSDSPPYSLGWAWRQALEESYAAEDALCYLLCLLQMKAEEADKAKTAPVPELLDLDGNLHCEDDVGSETAEVPPTSEEATTQDIGASYPEPLVPPLACAREATT